MRDGQVVALGPLSLRQLPQRGSQGVGEKDGGRPMAARGGEGKTSPRRRTSGDGGLCFVRKNHGQISSVSEGFIGFVHVDLDVVQGFHRVPPFPAGRGSMLKGLVVFVQQLFDFLNDFHGASSLFRRRSALEGSVVIVQELFQLFKGLHYAFSFRWGGRLSA